MSQCIVYWIILLNIYNIYFYIWKKITSYIFLLAFKIPHYILNKNKLYKNNVAKTGKK